MSSKDEKDKSPTDTTSAPDATPQWSLGVSLGVDPIHLTTVKCSNCKVPTEHEWVQITPIPMSDEALISVNADFTVLASRRRRLILCTQCGLLKTIT